MGMKHYPAEFKADAVALYQSRPGATIKEVAADLGVNPETLRNWLRAAGRTGRSRVSAGGASPAPKSGLEAENEALRRENAELKTERDILRRAAKYFAGGDALVNRFQFVADHRDAFGVKRLCHFLGLARSSFYYWLATASKRAARQAGDVELARRISNVHAGSDKTYGSPRVTAELRETGERINHKRVERVMRAFNIVGVHLRKKHCTTVADPAAAKAADLIGRDFTATTVNTKYVGDITYLPVSGAKPLYLATVIDLCSRRLAGWAIADHMRAELVIDALAVAERTRGSLNGAIFHCDHGSQYTSAAFAEACRSAGVKRSMSAVGSSADNAAAESFNASLKRETLQGAKAWPTARQARLDTFRWAGRYNTRRRHSRLGQRSPISYETTLDEPSTTLTQAA
ncbi:MULTISPECIES: IS3 family transposase [unclassified Streptomyces]|uniref:IS3 family transposase n=1 Tax=unclassified Streptomyces TaxID=2593676 RepID=UPI00382FE959